MLAGRFVLENKKGEVVRTFNLPSGSLDIIYRHDLKRVEVTNQAAALKKQGIKFDILKSTTTNKIKERALSLGNGSMFRFTDHIEKTASLVAISEDSEEQEKTIYKYTALTQLGLMLVVLIAGLLIEPLFMDKNPEEIVTVIPQELIRPQVKPTVAPAQQKIVKAKVADKKVESPVKKAELTAQAKTPRKENAPLRTKLQINKMGALGALGGMTNGSKNSAGFNMKALNDSKGTSWNGAGAGGVGGMERAVKGKGLIASAMGNGGKVEGGGGYGTRGSAGGGRPGYGTMNMGGTAAAYFTPVTEEALVEGGLTMDQIAAVINRHQGELINCYEKGLQVKPKLSGRVSMNFVISSSGRVSLANVTSSSLGDNKVESCALGRLKSWPFPKPVGGVNVKVSYPFVFSRVSAG